MNVKESLKRFGLVPRHEALPKIRALLANEAEAERLGEGREEDLALLCCVQLFARGLLEDVLLIWNAKSAGMDLGASLDVQLLCGAGLETTKSFLASQSRADAALALHYLVQCERAGDFEGFSPKEHLARYRDYFGPLRNACTRD
ncbi:hypothetical protein AKJ09_06833 [Labilithrix luteola]|uniref:Uncharacterized protein n=1 Tax=Labilithrix luteola TaxID=1391654 RepID=A0A0K1Q459_9BACT|nr:hypothetical protein [Labilithrix luteola]AKV00170.1 hypothetical protein AKJ09_06833 [Labilithrix luteola]